MFDQITGNERVKDLLRRMLHEQRVPGALLFSGEEGIGKKLFALELARALNCRARVGVEACGICKDCKRITNINYANSDEPEEKERFFGPIIRMWVWCSHHARFSCRANARD